MGIRVASSWPSFGKRLKQGARPTADDGDPETDTAATPAWPLTEASADGRDLCVRCGEPIELGLLAFGAIMCATCRAR